MNAYDKILLNAEAIIGIERRMLTEGLSDTEQVALMESVLILAHDMAMQVTKLAEQTKDVA
jgi:hypothetical protein